MKKKLFTLLFIATVFALSACGYKGGYHYFSIDIKDDFNIATGYGIAFPQHSSLVAPFNEVLEKMQNDDTITCLANYWTGDQSDPCYQQIDFTNPVYSIDYDGNGKTLKALTSSGYFPFEELDNNGKLYGFDIDIARLIAKELNVKINWEDNDFDKIVGDLANNKADFAIAAMNITSNRLKSVDFSDQYYDESVTVGIVRDDDKIASVSDLKDKIVCAQSGTVQADFIQKLKDEGKVKDVVFVNLPAAGMQSLKNKKVDVLFTEQYVADKLLSTMNTTK